MTDATRPPARTGLPRSGGDDARRFALLAHRLGGCATLAEVYETGAVATRDVLAAAVVGVHEVQQDEPTLVTTDPAEEQAAVEAVLADGDVLRALLRRQETWLSGPTTAGAPRPALAAPVVVNGTLWGLLIAVRDEGAQPFGPDDAARAEVLGALVGAHVARLDLAEQVRHLVSDDPLTGLSTRRVADEAAQRAIDTGDETCIVMCDVDGLKRVNDDLGHDAGDDLLRAVAGVLRRAGSGLPGSTTARIGGDEFCIVTSGIPRSTVVQVMESTVGDSPLPHGASLSYGIASSARGSLGAAPTPRSLFRRADAAQYHAKRSHAAARARQYRADDPGAVLGRTVAAGVTALSGTGAGVLSRLCALAAATTEAMGGSGWTVLRDVPVEGDAGRPPSGGGAAGAGASQTGTPGADEVSNAGGAPGAGGAVPPGTGQAGAGAGVGRSDGAALGARPAHARDHEDDGPRATTATVVARGGTSSLHVSGIRPLVLQHAPWTVTAETTLPPDDRTVETTLQTLVALAVAGAG
jgi:diguanylate cyclase (GGDEF)-like protein